MIVVVAELSLLGFKLDLGGIIVTLIVAALLFISLVVFPLMIARRVFRAARQVASSTSSALKAAQGLKRNGELGSSVQSTARAKLAEPFHQERLRQMLSSGKPSTIVQSGKELQAEYRPGPADKAANTKLDSETRQKLLIQSEKQYLAFRHVFPPRLPMTSLTFFGGAPIAGKDFVWPVATNNDGSRRPIHFMGQVDCSMIPSGPNRHLLPDKGILYFFAPSTGFEQRDLEKHCVIYVEEVNTDLAEVTPPADLGLAPSQSYRVWQYGLPAGRVPLPKTYRKVEMDMGWLNTIELPEGLDSLDSEEKNQAFDAWAKTRNSYLATFYGEPGGLPHLGYYGELGPENLQGFPWNYHGILVFCGMARQWLNSNKPYASETTDLPGVAALPENQNFWRETGYWIDKALANNLANAVSKEDSANFLDWINQLAIGLPGCKPASEHDAVSRGLGTAPVPVEKQQQAARRMTMHWLSEAVRESAEFGLQATSDFSSTLPAVVLERLRAQHHPTQKHLWRDFSHTRHQMLGIGRDIQGFASEIREQQVLLMQFDSDSGINWQTGDVGAFYFAIDPEDLMNRNFDKITCTFECN